MVLKLGMKLQGPKDQRLKLHRAYINYSPVLTLVYFTARSNMVSCVLYVKKTVCNSFNGSNSNKLQQMTTVQTDVYI